MGLEFTENSDYAVLFLNMLLHIFGVTAALSFPFFYINKEMSANPASTTATASSPEDLSAYVKFHHSFVPHIC